MIPPANMIQDESGGNEEDQDQIETPKAPTTDSSQQETKVRLSALLFTIATIPRDIQIYCGISISPSLINRAGQTNFFQQDNKTDSTGS